MARLLKERNGNTYVKDVKLEEDPENLKGLLNETRWNILKLLAERPRYPAEIADKLEIHEQKVYYHIKQLKKDDIIEISDKVHRGGAVAKYYRLKDYGFAFELPYGDEKLMDFPIKEEKNQTKEFLYPFVQNGELNSKIVVGSPDPHGPHQTRARDGHYGNDIALFLGQHAAIPGDFTTKLDIDVKAENFYDTNLICIGGPLTNVLTDKFNQYLPVKFESEDFPFRKLISDKTGKEYTEESIGIISKVVNPEDTEKRVMVLAGTRTMGTKSAVLALTRHEDEILDDYEGEDNWARIVKGKDMDGDGKIDEIEVLE